jgi:predicted Ser/Thr protein kinase
LATHFPDLEILKLLGQGGMGAVYQARQRKLDRLVALKVLPSDWSRDPAFAERFAREARALARLNHPEIVGVHDFGEAGGHYYLIMEFVDGANLRQVLGGGRLQPRQALSIVAQVCDALQYAHEQGVVHRDIKPENILLDKRGRAKIADFGLAKLLRRTRSEFTLTGTGQVMGTIDYMAPEQRSSPQAVDHRADIYSLGVVFYEMLTGELPLGRFNPPSSRAAVDGRLDEVINRALEREPDRRYQRISAVKDDVESILRAQPISPAASPRAPVRSFFQSVVSLFVPRSNLGLRGGRPALASTPPAPLPARHPGRRGWGFGLFWTAVSLLCMGLFLYLRAGINVGTAARAQENQLQGVLVADMDELATTLHLDSGQLQTIKQVLTNADREYLELEQRHTSRKVSQEAGSDGHLLVTISPFSEEATQLENRVWAKLNTVLLESKWQSSHFFDQQEAAKKQLPPRGALFAFGQEETKIEIWQDEAWYHWIVTQSRAVPRGVRATGKQDGPGRVATTEEGSGAELPRRYQRFWQGGPP